MKKRSTTRTKINAMKVLSALTCASFLTIAIINVFELTKVVLPDESCASSKQRQAFLELKFQLKRIKTKFLGAQNLQVCHVMV